MIHTHPVINTWSWSSGSFFTMSIFASKSLPDFFWPTRTEKPFSLKAGVFPLAVVIQLRCAEPLYGRQAMGGRQKGDAWWETERDNAGKGRQRDKETNRKTVMCTRQAVTAGAQTRLKSNLVVEKSHCCTDVRSVGSPAGSSLGELDSIWQVSGDNSMTGLFPWEHICHWCGARPKSWRGITNEDCRTGGKINHTNDNSKRELQQNVKITSARLVSLPRFPPWNGNLAGGGSVFFWVA